MNEMMIWEDKGPVGSANLTTLQKALIDCVNKLYDGNVGEGKGTPVAAKDIIKVIQANDELNVERKGKPYTKEDINKTLERLVEKMDLRKVKRGLYTPAIY
jgi:predicted transcriptional regulator of viral defense system